MHFVKHFNINGVDTKQVACIELQGKPNAATEGAVGLLGMDMTSPTHEVYKCVAVNGSIYTWELLSTGMSIICATVTGSGALKRQFGYSSLLTPANYLIKVGDIILDSSGYLYQVSAINAEYCDTTFCKIKLGGTGNGNTYTLDVEDGKLRLLTLNGDVVSEIDIMLPDGETITRDPSTGEASVRGVKTINDSTLRFFEGTQDEYEALENKSHLFPILDGGDLFSMSAYAALWAKCVVGESIEDEVSEDGTYVTVDLEPDCVYVVRYYPYYAVLCVGTGMSIAKVVMPVFGGEDGEWSGFESRYMCYSPPSKKFTVVDESLNAFSLKTTPISFKKIAIF